MSGVLHDAGFPAHAHSIHVIWRHSNDDPPILPNVVIKLSAKIVWPPDIVVGGDRFYVM